MAHVIAVADWIQAHSQLIMILLTLLTLIVLWGYARDTKRIANDSASQAERAQMPFLAVALNEAAVYCVENQGLGPALNIVCEYSDREGKRKQRIFPSLAAKGAIPLSDKIKNTLDKGDAFVISYNSLSPKDRYRTEVRMVEQEIRTEFHKV